jgi:Flp pilus assembly protein TadB
MATCPPDIENCPRVEEHVQRRKWYLNRGINLDTIIALVLMSAAFVGWAMHQENRQTIVEATNDSQNKDISELKSRITTERGEMRDDIKEIKEQVNKLVERRR